jgi:hypothetical protein
LHWSETTGKDGAKHEDEDNSDGRGRLVAMICVSGRTTSNNSETCSHTSSGRHEHLSAADNIVQTGTDDGRNPADEGIDDVEDQFGVSVCDADAVEHDWQVVRYNAKDDVSLLLLPDVTRLCDLLVTAELTEPRESDVEHQSVPAGAGFHKDL